MLWSSSDGNPFMYIRYRVYIPNNKGILVASLTRTTSGNRTIDFAASMSPTRKNRTICTQQLRKTMTPSVISFVRYIRHARTSRDTSWSGFRFVYRPYAVRSNIFRRTEPVRVHSRTGGQKVTRSLSLFNLNFALILVASPVRFGNK